MRFRILRPSALQGLRVHSACMVYRADRVSRFMGYSSMLNPPVFSPRQAPAIRRHAVLKLKHRNPKSSKNPSLELQAWKLQTLQASTERPPKAPKEPCITFGNLGALRKYRTDCLPGNISQQVKGQEEALGLRLIIGAELSWGVSGTGFQV